MEGSVAVSSSTSAAAENNFDHHYHLGGINYAVVTHFSNSILLHLRKYRQGKNGKLFPTKKGVTLTTTNWLNLLKNAENYQELLLAGQVVILDDSLLIAKADLDVGPHITFQRYFRKEDFSRKFCASMCVLSEQEFIKLMSDWNLQRRISESMIEQTYVHQFPQCVLKEVAKYSNPTSPPLLQQSDIEMLLTTSLVELLKTYIEENVATAFQCNGCAQNYNNQLGHACMTYNYDQQLFSCGHVAILSINVEKLSQNFVETNASIVNYININFFSKLDIAMLLHNAKELFIASDPLPMRMF